MMISFLFFFYSSSQAQPNYNIKMMSWNLLNFPGASTAADSTLRCPYYRTVVNYVEPDILVTMENTSANGASWVLSNVMNSGTSHYSQGTFINGYDSDNAIYYKDSLFQFISNVPIQTALRDISHYTLSFIPTGDTIHIFVVHLKASQGYEQNRYDEVALLRQVTNLFPAETNFLVAGDFNIYSSFEPAYGALLQDNSNDDGNFLDPIVMNGTWNYYPFAQYHTQSTRILQFGGGSTGGLNDRFDMILFSNAVQKPRGVYYLPGSTGVVGNDGLHFNKAMNNGMNSSVPLSVANALYGASDHLPVYLTLQIGPTTDVTESSFDKSIAVFPNPSEGIFSVQLNAFSKSKVSLIITDLTGRKCFELVDYPFLEGNNLIQLDLSKNVMEGLYLLSITDGKVVVNKKLSIY